jgi:hypothetical protein
MHYLVIERFNDAPVIYRRLSEKGRMMPEGLNYVSSWIDHNLKTCWQVLETEDFVLLERWIDNWKDLMEFEIIPVRTSAEVVELMKREGRCLPHLNPLPEGEEAPSPTGRRPG